MNGCVNLIRFILFLLHSVFLLVFSSLTGGTAYLLVNLSRLFPVPPDSGDGLARSYHLAVVLLLLLFTSLALLACLGCVGPATKSSCLMKTFISLLLPLICSTLAGLVFLNMESGRKMAVEFTQEVVSDALEDSLSLTGNRREIARHIIDSFPAWKPPTYLSIRHKEPSNTCHLGALSWFFMA